MVNLAYFHWCSQDQCKIGYSIPDRSPWKLEITVLGTATTVIAVSFQFAHHGHYSENILQLLNKYKMFSNWERWGGDIMIYTLPHQKTYYK